MLKTWVKRAAFHGTVAAGRVQRGIGRRFPRYARFWRRAAGYAAFAMAGEPVVSTQNRPGGASPDGAAPAPLPRPRPVVGDRAVVCIEEPIDAVDRGFFQLRGWIAAERPITDLEAVVNGVTFRLATYRRPDVAEHHRGRTTAGFSAFVRLGDVPDPRNIAIRLRARGEDVAGHAVAATPAAVAVGTRDADARRAKREWLLGRLACVVCGGGLDERATCRSCGKSHLGAETLDCIPSEARSSSDIEFNGAVCSHGYDGDVERVIARAEAAGGMVLDCGAGLRPTSRPRVVTTDIFPYPTTDVLAVNERLPFQDAIFDAVLSLHVLEHVADPFVCARELYRVLKPGGTLFAVTPMIVPEHGFPHHFFNPTREGLARLFGRTGDTARVFVPAMGHPINGVWTTLAVYRDSLPAAEQEKFVGLTVRDLLGRPIEDWITREIAVALSEDGRMRLAANFCIEFVK